MYLYYKYILYSFYEYTNIYIILNLNHIINFIKGNGYENSIKTYYAP